MAKYTKMPLPLYSNNVEHINHSRETSGITFGIWHSISLWTWANVQCPGIMYMNFDISRILRRPSSVGESAISHGITLCGDGVVYIESGSCSCSAGYGNSSSSSCFLSASFCIHFIASVKMVSLDAKSTSHFSTPLHPALGMTGEPRDTGVPWLDPQPEPSAHDNPTSMGKPRGRPSSSWLSRLVTGETMPLARPPMLESPDPPEVSRWMGGMVAVSLLYTGGVQGPGVGDAFLNARGSYTLSKPNSWLSLASRPAALVSLGVVYGWGTSGPGVLHWGWRCQCGYLASSMEDVAIPVTLACSCLFLCASWQSSGSRILSASALALLSLSWASAFREQSYSCSVACYKLFKAAWHLCCLSNSACCGPSNNAQAFSQP